MSRIKVLLNYVERIADPELAHELRELVEGKSDRIRDLLDYTERVAPMIIGSPQWNELRKLVERDQ